MHFGAQFYVVLQWLLPLNDFGAETIKQLLKTMYNFLPGVGCGWRLSLKSPSVTIVLDNKIRLYTTLIIIMYDLRRLNRRRRYV